MALALAGLLVNGCDVSEVRSERPSTDGAISTLEDSIHASFDGDAQTVCALQTSEYSAAIVTSMAKQGFVDADVTCEEAMLVLSGMIAGFGGAGYALDEVSFLDESADGKTVTLRATYAGGRGNHEKYEVSYIDGHGLVSGDAETQGTLSSGVARSPH